MEGTQENGAIPFFDTLITPLADNSLSFQVYWKPTHTDQYLQWDCHHSLSSKCSVIGTLTHGAKVVCTNSELLQGELNHLRRALGKCNYPTWAIKRVQQKVLNNNPKYISNNNPTNTSNTNDNQGSNPTIYGQRNKATIGQVVIPYTKGIAQSIKQTCGKYGIQVHFKGNTTIKQVLMKPKDQDPKDSKSGIRYSYQCQHLDCDEEYIGEAARSLGGRRKEHLKQPSLKQGHSQTTQHSIKINNFNIIGREDQDHQGIYI